MSKSQHRGGRVLDAAVATATTITSTEVDALARACESVGLLTLATTVERLSPSDIRGAIRTAYAAAEIQASLTWRRGLKSFYHA